MTRAIVAVALALTLAPSAPAAQAGQGAKDPPSASAAPKGGAPSAGAGSASAAKPSPTADRVARELTTQPSWNETVGAYAQSLSTQIGAALKAQGGEPPKDVEQRVRSGLDRAVGYEEVVRLQAQALAGRFSEDELRQIQKFYETGAGKKLVSELPAVSRQVIDVVQERISAAIPKIVEDVAPSLARAKTGSGGEGGTSTGSGAAEKEGPGSAQGRKPPPQPSRP
jgi:hypothetical protein